MKINNIEEALNFFHNKSTNELIEAAKLKREKLFSNKVDFCAIVNCKSGQCSENCRFCSQSKYYITSSQNWDLLDSEEILKAAKEAKMKGASRFSLVSSGRALTSSFLEQLLPIYKKIQHETGLKICSSHGFITLNQAIKLKKAAVCRYHHNLESSRSFYSEVCTTHDFDQRIETIQAAVDAGLSTCSGGIWGLGESIKQRLEMAFELKNLNVDSVPINILNPVPGTPMEMQKPLASDEIIRSIALYRLILPHQSIRIAGGRSLICKEDQITIIQCGVDAFMIGNYLTTLGMSHNEDLAILKAANRIPFNHSYNLENL